ncbi:MAG TPA: NAD(P)/FAD-dependent oxidoreductase [Streptosporangiaceae bacterium]|nr:NAD(P)/FAD-dependent oxidoreductase [Streptosporangiaceae bacterium]
MNASQGLARPRVVIVGAGMAGLATVRALARAPVTVQLIDTHNYTTFPPLLFQVATCFISPAEVARPVRALLRRNPAASFLMGHVVDVDWPGRRVLLEDGSAAAFDYLVLAPGVVPAFAGVPGAAAHAIPLKLVTDATQLRNRLLRSFETAAARPGSAAPGATSIAVVGGGPTGVELSGYIANFLFHYQFEADYPQLDPAAMGVTLLERGDRLLPGFHPALSAYALKMLRSRGVDVRLSTDVIEVDGDGVTISGGQRIPAATVVWAAGVDAPPWVKALGLAVRDGRVVTSADLRVPGHPDTFAIGDLAAVPAPGAGGLRPQLAQVAIQTGRHAGRQIRRLAAGQPATRFSYVDKGMMAIIGRNAAIVQAGRVRLTGRLAWVTWGFLHLTYLPGALNRMTAGMKYLWWHLSHENTDRVLIEPEPAAGPAAPLARQPGVPGGPPQARSPAGA